VGQNEELQRISHLSQRDDAHGLAGTADDTPTFFRRRKTNLRHCSEDCPIAGNREFST
jgi:hypothetical protein